VRALPGVGPLAAVSRETLAAVAATARRLQCGVFAIAGRDESDVRDAREQHGMTPMARLFREEILDERAIVVPGRALPEPDWELLGASGAAWVATPREDIEERGTQLDYVALAERGLWPALGSGGLTPHMPGEGEMIFRGARLLNRSAAEAKAVVVRALFEQGPALARRHFGPGLGSLAPGSPADLIVLDVYPATPLGPENWTDHLVQSLATARVHAAIVAGDLLLQDGRALVVSERELQQKSRAIVHRLWPKVTP
jgi:cytosine/adenosine deaminase-related metal-dependent hydrolase